MPVNEFMKTYLLTFLLGIMSQPHSYGKD